MKVFLIGANGQIGQRLVSLFKENADHSVRAMVRKEEQKASLEAAGAEAVLANLEGSRKKSQLRQKAVTRLFLQRAPGAAQAMIKRCWWILTERQKQ